MLVRYTGPETVGLTLADVPEAGTFVRGNTVEVPDHIGENLLLQHHFEAAESASTTKSAKNDPKES